MSPKLNPRPAPRLERSCGPAAGDWIAAAPAQPGLERIEAWFSGHAYDSHRHDTYALGMTLAGVQSFDYRGARADSQPGNLVVLHPDEAHDGRAGQAGGFRYRMAYVAPHLIRDALGGRAGALPFVRGAVSRDPRLSRAVVALLRDLERDLEPLELDQALTALADALLALDPSAATGRGGGGVSERAVERARQYLDARCETQVTSGELEAVSGLDRYTLARQFRRRLGASPHRYLTLRRLDRVKQSLRRGESLSFAALDAGFADQSHMTRRFAQAYGLPPGRWRALLGSGHQSGEQGEAADQGHGGQGQEQGRGA